MDKIICYCKSVSEQEIQNAILEGAKSLKDIQNTTGACTGNQCKELNPSRKCCCGDILKMVDRKETENGSCCCECE